MEFVQLVIKTTTGNTVVRQPISWAWPGNRCMYQVTVLRPHCLSSTLHTYVEFAKLKLMKSQSYCYF